MAKSTQMSLKLSSKIRKTLMIVFLNSLPVICGVSSSVSMWIRLNISKTDLFFQWKSARGKQRTEGAIFKCGIGNATDDIVGCTLKVADRNNISEDYPIAFGEIYEECVCCDNNCYLGIEDRGNLPILC